MRRFFSFNTFSLYCLCILVLSLWASTAFANIPVLKTGGKHSPAKGKISTPVVSASIPVINDTAKSKSLIRPRKSNTVLTVTEKFLTLGSRGNISAVKARPSAYAPTKSLLYKASPRRINQQISAKSAIIIDAGTGKVIFSKSADTPRQPASTIKVLTGLIAIKSLKQNSLVDVSRKAARMPRSKIYIDPKKKYKADDLINAVLLASANDASVALAEEIAGSEKEFAKIMTLRAKLWGAKNTICKTANGLTARGQQTTARDLAVIFRHVMEDKDFAKRIGRTKTKTSYGKLLRNHNKALWRIKGAVGGKTGYTRAAGQTYVGKFSNGKNSIIVAIMGSKKMWGDIKKLVDHGFRQQSKVQLASNK